MLARIASALCLSLSLSATRLAAQAPTAVPVPNTPVGTVIRAWLDAFASGDTVKILDYYRRYQPERIAAQTVNFRLGSGGFDVLSIERSEPRHIELVVRERNTPQTGYAIVDLAPTDPIRVTSSTMMLLGPNSDLSFLRVGAAARGKVIEGAIAQLDSAYVFPEVAKRMADSLRGWNARGRYNADSTSFGFAAKLNADVRELSHDKHMGVSFTPRVIPPLPANPAPRTPEQQARDQQEMDRMNCAFVKAEQLEGNVGYVKFNAFFDVGRLRPDRKRGDELRRRLARADHRPARQRRRLTGDGHATSRRISSRTRTHLNDSGPVARELTEEFWTRDVPGRRFGGEKPVYVLTSAHTFSGGEEFTVQPQGLKARDDRRRDDGRRRASGLGAIASMSISSSASRSRARSTRSRTRTGKASGSSRM